MEQGCGIRAGIFVRMDLECFFTILPSYIFMSTVVFNLQKFVIVNVGVEFLSCRHVGNALSLKPV
jgi:hypothetical protein